MLRRSYVIAVCVALIAWSLYARFWKQTSVPHEPITIEAGMVVVENQSEREWRNVVVTVNDHFHGGARSLAAGSRLNAPLSQFATSGGQRFDRGRQSVFKFEVKATDASGEPVRLEWIARTTS